MNLHIGKTLKSKPHVPTDREGEVGEIIRVAGSMCYIVLAGNFGRWYSFSEVERDFEEIPEESGA